MEPTEDQQETSGSNTVIHWTGCSEHQNKIKKMQMQWTQKKQDRINAAAVNTKKQTNADEVNTKKQDKKCRCSEQKKTR